MAGTRQKNGKPTQRFEAWLTPDNYDLLALRAIRSEVSMAVVLNEILDRERDNLTEQFAKSGFMGARLDPCPKKRQ
jgi:hypothetical protein